MIDHRTRLVTLSIPGHVIDVLGRLSLAENRRVGAPVTTAPKASAAWLEIAYDALTGPDARDLTDDVEVAATVAAWVWAATTLRRAGHPDGESLYLQVLSVAASFAAA